MRSRLACLALLTLLVSSTAQAMTATSLLRFKEKSLREERSQYDNSPRTVENRKFTIAYEWGKGDPPLRMLVYAALMRMDLDPPTGVNTIDITPYFHPPYKDTGLPAPGLVPPPIISRSLNTGAKGYTEEVILPPTVVMDGEVGFFFVLENELTGEKSWAQYRIIYTLVPGFEIVDIPTKY